MREKKKQRKDVQILQIITGILMLLAMVLMRFYVQGTVLFRMGDSPEMDIGKNFSSGIPLLAGVVLFYRPVRDTDGLTAAEKKCGPAL